MGVLIRFCFSLCEDSKPKNTATNRQLKITFFTFTLTPFQQEDRTVVCEPLKKTASKIEVAHFMRLNCVDLYWTHRARAVIVVAVVRF